MSHRLPTVLAALALMIAACSSASGPPSEFDAMETGDVGCTATVADDPLHVFSPLGPNDAQTFSPTDGFSIRVENRHAGVAAIATEYSEAKGGDIVTSKTKGWDVLPTDGEGAEIIRADVDDEHTLIGFIVRCWKGEG